jgi:hypothetical protein
LAAREHRARQRTVGRLRDGSTQSGTERHGGHSKSMREKNLGRDCDAHRLPIGSTAAKRRIQLASCRSGKNTVRRSTTATVQGVGPICEINEILVAARNRRQPAISVALKKRESVRAFASTLQWMTLLRGASFRIVRSP